MCQLDEVTITATRPTEGAYAIVPFIYVYDYHQENEELLGDFAWDSNGGGGSNSGSGTSCTGDKVYNSATNSCNCPSGTVENSERECVEYIEEDIKICLSSLEFSDVGANWQAAGIKNVNIQFLTIGSPTKLVNVYISELYIGLPKESPLVGGYLTNHNARTEGQTLITKAEGVTDLYQSINPNSNSVQLRDYFYTKLREFTREKGGEISTTAPLGWNGQLKEHQTYIVSSGLECD
ncbi:hypothetical protein [Tenacibaculum geojense]|uniref:Lipoprotein n=1 Tax=Tenacibaculum geojense TaxID=915352 RepID=A0ABW3JNV0_9FLAO